MSSQNDSRLRQVRKEAEKTVEEFAGDLNIAAKTQTAYENGSRNISIDYAIKVCNKYNITLDWLLGRTAHKADNDLMVSLILALDKVFKVGYKTICHDSNYKYRELTLWIDTSFRDYLEEIRDLENARRITKQITDEIYTTSRQSIQEKYAKVLKQLFGEINCEIDESKFINIQAVEDCDFLQLLL